MPMYYFHLRNHDRITDIDGTELPDIDAARGHAVAVARELKFKNNEMMGKDWSEWSMAVHDHDGLELFAFEMSDVSNGDGN